MKNIATLAAVAKKAKVSLATASKIINGRHDSQVAEATKTRVLQMAEKLGYHGSLAHQILNGHETGLVGIYFSTLRLSQEPHLLKLVIQLADAFQKQNKKIILEILDPSLDQDFILGKIKMGVDYFIFLGSPPHNSSTEAHLIKYQKEFVCYGGQMARCLLNDVPEAMFQVLVELAAQGYSTWKLLTRPPVGDWGQLSRVMGLMKYYPELTLEEIREKHLEEFEPHTEEAVCITQAGYESTKKLFMKGDQPEVLIYYSDDYALGGLRYLYEANLLKTVKVIGVNDTPAARFGLVPFTSIAFDLEKVVNYLLKPTSIEGTIKILPFTNWRLHGEKK